MSRSELLEFLGVENLFTLTREQIETEFEFVLEKIDSGCSPILIISDEKPDLLLFGWEDYKRRFSMIYSPEEFERLERAFCEFEEEE